MYSYILIFSRKAHNWRTGIYCWSNDDRHFGGYDSNVHHNMCGFETFQQVRIIISVFFYILLMLLTTEQDSGKTVPFLIHQIQDWWMPHCSETKNPRDVIQKQVSGDLAGKQAKCRWGRLFSMVTKNNVHRSMF